MNRDSKARDKTAYVSGRVGKEDRTREFISELENLGYSVTVDWTGLDVRKPYQENRDHNVKAALQMSEAARDADCFVLLVDAVFSGHI